MALKYLGSCWVEKVSNGQSTGHKRILSCDGATQIPAKPYLQWECDNAAALRVKVTASADDKMIGLRLERSIAGTILITIAPLVHKRS